MINNSTPLQKTFTRTAIAGATGNREDYCEAQLKWASLTLLALYESIGSARNHMKGTK